MNQILEIDPAGRFARVQPGVVLDTLRNRAEKHQLTFGPDPSTHSRCTLGGMIGNNSCGTHSLAGGKDRRQRQRAAHSAVRRHADDRGRHDRRGRTRFHHRAGRTPRRDLLQAAGHSRSVRRPDPREISRIFPGASPATTSINCCRKTDLTWRNALVGTEGTCVIVLEAKLRLIQSPQHRSLVCLGYRDTFSAADHVPEILPLKPIGLEGFEGSIVDGLKKKNAPNLELIPGGTRLPAGGIWFERSGRGGRGRAPADRAAETGRPILRTCVSTPRPKRATSGSCANPGRARPPPRRARRPNGKDGTTRLSRRKNWATTCAISASCSTNTTTTPRSTAISGTAAFTCA